MDLRAKNSRNPEHKWMNGADVDDYVLGPERNPRSKSPGLAVNTHVLNEFVFELLSSAAESSAAPSLPAACPMAAASPAAAAPVRRGGGSR
eukprot:5998564-Pleurochrysis_carterae.AAC.1